MRELILFIMLHIICYVLISCAEPTQPYFIASGTMLQPCTGVIHHDSNKLTNVIDDIIENDRNHTLCKEMLANWQEQYNKYIKEHN
jgi:hypothetical protein